jgi:hypothetical protein
MAFHLSPLDLFSANTISAVTPDSELKSTLLVVQASVAAQEVGDSLSPAGN